MNLTLEWAYFNSIPEPSREGHSHRKELGGTLSRITHVNNTSCLHSPEGKNTCDVQGTRSHLALLVKDNITKRLDERYYQGQAGQDRWHVIMS